MPTGGGAKAPKPSAEERALQAQQTELLKRQQDALDEQLRMQDLLAPLFYKQAGITPRLDESGRIIGFDQAEKSQEQLNQDAIQLASQQRTLAGLRGELPVDAGTLQELAKQQQYLEDSLTKQLGAGWATSTPGIQAMAEFGKNKSSILDAARRGDINMGEGINLAQASLAQRRQADFLQQNAGIAGLNNQSLFGPINQGYGNALQYYQGNRQQGLQASMANSQAGSSMFGSAAGIGAGALLALAML